MSRIAPTGLPFFRYVAVGAPHAPQSPARRHKDMFADETVPRSPSYNEADVSDKLKPIRRLSSLTSNETAEVDEIYLRNRTLGFGRWLGGLLQDRSIPIRLGFRQIIGYLQ